MIAYRSIQVFIHKKSHPDLYAYLSHNAALAKNLYNASLYRLRQTFTAHNKTTLTKNELEVLKEQQFVCQKHGLLPLKQLSYNRLVLMMQETNNPDYFSGLPNLCIQSCIKRATSDMEYWQKALREYQKMPSKFTGKPKIPKYCKSKGKTLTYTKKDIFIYNGYVTFPKTNVRLHLPNLSCATSFIQLIVKPMFDGFMLYFVVKKELDQREQGQSIAAIDLGVDNIAAVVTNEGHSYLYKGGIVKAINQFYNKNIAHYTSVLQKQTKAKYVSSKRLTKLNKKRYFQIKDYFHKISKDILQKCVEHNVGTLIIGENKTWKQEVGLGKHNNQNFVSIPFDVLKMQLTYKAKALGIQVVFVEEAYTSKADFLSNDTLPTYRKGMQHKATSFSGTRIQRGLYQSKTGIVLNADIHAACNIMRKYREDGFEQVNDLTYLKRPHVIRNLFVQS